MKLNNFTFRTKIIKKYNKRIKKYYRNLKFWD